MKRLSLIILFLMLHFPPLKVCNADYKETYVKKDIQLLSYKPLTELIEIFSGENINKYRYVAFDDNDRLYVLYKTAIMILNEQSQLIKTVPLTENIHYSDDIFPDYLEVSAGGQYLYVGIGTTMFLLDQTGRTHRKVENIGSNLTRRIDGTLIDRYSTAIYNEKLGVIKHINKYEPIRFVDKGKNYYQLKGDILYKMSSAGKTIWEKEYRDLIRIEGIDIQGNIYAMAEDELTMYKLNNNGEAIAEIKLLPYSELLSEKIRDKVYPYSDEPRVLITITGDGDIYQRFSFRQFSNQAYKHWLKEGGQYVIYKYEFSDQMSEKSENNMGVTVDVRPRTTVQPVERDRDIEFLSNIFQSKKYQGNKRHYDESDMMIADISESIDRLFIKSLRNEIFARHGRIFNSEDLTQIFEACDWYKPDPNYSDDMLNDIERKNIRFILDYEKKMGWR